MNTDESLLKNRLESLLFVSDEPVSGARLAEVLDVSAGQIDAQLADLAQEYTEQNRGFQLREVAGGWRLFTHPGNHELIERYVLSWDTRRLSQAALEALAVIAYNQPVSRATINAIRGVNSEGVISSLVDKGLVREAGRDRNQGNAILYATTRSFLEKFGLKDLTALPPLEEFAPDDTTQSIIRQRLGAADAATGDVELDEEVATAQLGDAVPQKPTSMGEPDDDTADELEDIDEVN